MVIETELLPPVQLLEDPDLLLQEVDLPALLLIQPAGDREEQHSHWHRQHGRQFTRSRIRLGALKGSAFRRAYLLIKPRLSVRLTIGTARRFVTNFKRV
jgi:hypothetical protein